MQKFYSVQLSPLPRLAVDWKAGLPASGFWLGRIEKIIGPGRFVVLLESGSRVTAESSRTLKIDSRVRVFPPRDVPTPARAQKEPQAASGKESGTYWTAFLPLGFGGKKASSRLQVFVEEKQDGLWDKNVRAIYFVIWTKTEKLGSLQWSVYLKGLHVSLQVFAEQGIVDKDELKGLAVNVEQSLKSRGFLLLAPTVYLRHPFNVPEGFRLNVRG